MTMEIRGGAELRADSAGKLVGHAAVFNKRSLDLGGFVEIIQPGAFKSSLKQDIRALIDHQGIAIARTANGTLRVREDDIGLEVEIDLPDTTAGNDIRKSVERGDVDQMSFGFSVREGGQVFSEDEDGTIIRTLTDVNLIEASIVTFPAYPDTDVAKRSVQAWREMRFVPPSVVAKRKELMQKRLQARGL
jgi:HK97 family phage prohead protease